jgi:hypothetical protein
MRTARCFADAVGSMGLEKGAPSLYGGQTWSDTAV